MAATRRAQEFFDLRPFGRPCMSYSVPTDGQEAKFEDLRDRCTNALSGGQQCANVLQHRQDTSSDCRLMCISTWAGQWMMDAFESLTDTWMQIPLVRFEFGNVTAEGMAGVQPVVPIIAVKEILPVIRFSVENVIICSTTTTLRVKSEIRARMDQNEFAEVITTIQQVDRIGYSDPNGLVYNPFVLRWSSGDVSAAVVRFQELADRLAKATTHLFGELSIGGGIDFVAPANAVLLPFSGRTATFETADIPPFVLGGFFEPQDWKEFTVSLLEDRNDQVEVSITAFDLLKGRQDAMNTFYTARGWDAQQMEDSFIHTMDVSPMETKEMLQVTTAAIPQNPDARVNLCSMRNASAPEETSFAAVLPELLQNDIQQHILRLEPYDTMSSEEAEADLTPKLSLFRELVGDEAYNTFRDGVLLLVNAQDAFIGDEDNETRRIWDFILGADPFVEPVPQKVTWEDMISRLQEGHFFVGTRAEGFPEDGIFKGHEVPARCVVCGHLTPYESMFSKEGMRYSVCRRVACKRFLSSVSADIVTQALQHRDRVLTDAEATAIADTRIANMSGSDRQMSDDELVRDYPEGVFAQNGGVPFDSVSEVRDRWMKV